MSKTESHVIEIPAGEHFIEAGLIPNWIADRLVHVPDGPPLLRNIQKKIPEAKPSHFRVEDLTDEDVDYLRHLWAGLNIPPAWNMTREQWAICYRAFQDAPNRPAWDVQADFDDFHGQARGERGQAAFKHFKLIEEAAKAGKLCLLDQHRAPTTKLEPRTLISIEHVRAYLAPLGFELRQVEPTSTTPAKDAEAIPGKISEKTGVASAVLIEKFHLGNVWVSRLSHPNRHAYMKPALVQRGRRGKGNEGHLWNPAQFAMMLMTREGKNMTALETTIERNFPDWLDAWHEISGWNQV